MTNTIFKVEKGVPIPNDVSIDRRFYPWTDMTLGDSFFVEGAKVTAMSAKAAWAGRQYGKRYVCRTVEGGVRIWCMGEREPREPRKKHKPYVAEDAPGQDPGSLALADTVIPVSQQNDIATPTPPQEG